MMLPLSPANLAVTNHQSESLPLVSMLVLRDLEHQLDDVDGCTVFVRNFIEMWDDRYTRLAGSVRAWNELAAMEAVLSLKCSSQMVGAERLSRLVGELEYEVKQRHRGSAATLLESVRNCGTQTMVRLQQGYLRHCV